MGRKGGRKYALKLLVNRRVLELLGRGRRSVQWDREVGILQRDYPTFCSLGVQQEACRANQGTCMYSHLKMPKGV